MARRIQLADSLIAALPAATDATDSTRILEDLFDLDATSRRIGWGYTLLDLAERRGDDTRALDMIRNLANLQNRSDSVLNALEDHTASFPPSDDRSATRTFIQMLRNTQAARYATQNDKEERLHTLLHQATLCPPTDPYERTAMLHALCAYIADLSQGEVLAKYSDQLDSLISQLPHGGNSLRSIFYVQAAVNYAETSLYERSIDADRHLLEVMDSLETYYHRNGRKYRTYDPIRYIVCQRMLSNYPALTDAEASSLYAMARHYAATNARAKTTYERTPLIDVYYKMKTRDYAAALPLLKNALANPANKAHKRRLLRYTMECARAMGDSTAMLDAAVEYSGILESYIDRQYQEKYKELQILYDVQTMESENAALRLERKITESRLQRYVLAGVIVSACLLAILTIVLWRQRRHTRRMANTLAETNRALLDEDTCLRQSKAEALQARDEAQKANNMKTDFLKNLNDEVKVPIQTINEYSRLLVDSANVDGKKYLERFADLIETNTELLTTVVNDVLHLAELDSDTIVMTPRVTDLRHMCALAVDTVRPRTQPGVRMMFDADASPDIKVFTDSMRLQQIVVNLLRNAAKFTHEGEIALAYSTIDDGATVRLTVTDTGIGVSPANAERIFDRFVKINHDSQGAGLGLTISRLLARRMGGDVVLDTTYTRGARFIFTFPTGL